MTDRLKGTLMGVLFSLGAVVIWVILTFIGFIAGLAGALMGILFVMGYQKFNPSDKSKYVVFVACILIVVEIVVAELLAIAIIAGFYEVPFADALAIPEVQTGIILDVVIGLVLSFAVFVGYLYSRNRKNQLNDRRMYTGMPNAYPMPYGMLVERTYVMLKPGFLHLTGEIQSRIEAAGLRVLVRDERVLNGEILRRHYEEHLSKPFYPGLEEYMLSDAVCCMVVEGENAVAKMRELMGATKDAESGTIRGDYAESITKNVIHGSDSQQSAQREIAIFFPGF